MATKKTTSKKTSTKSKAKKPVTKKKSVKKAEPKQETADVKQEAVAQPTIVSSSGATATALKVWETPKPFVPQKKKKSLWRRIFGFGF